MDLTNRLLARQNKDAEGISGHILNYLVADASSNPFLPVLATDIRNSLR